MQWVLRVIERKVTKYRRVSSRKCVHFAKEVLQMYHEL